MKNRKRAQAPKRFDKHTSASFDKYRHGSQGPRMRSARYDRAKDGRGEWL